jgi:hypothetical protein
MKKTHKILISLMFCVSSSVNADFIPLDLLDSSLYDTSTYAQSTVNLGAGTNVGGNMQGFNPITIGAGSTIGGNVSAGTTVLTGENSFVGGNVQAGTSVNTGVGSVVKGNISSGTTTLTGATSTVEGDIIAGGQVLFGAFATAIVPKQVISQNINSAGSNDYNEDYEAPSVESQDDQLGEVQERLRLMGQHIDPLHANNLPITFGVTDTTLFSGIYQSDDYLNLRSTLTLDGNNEKGDFLFNIRNQLAFAAGTKVKLVNFHDDSKIIWNILGDLAPDTGGFMKAAADVEIRGFIIARSFVETGARSSITGVGVSCGGALSRQGYIKFDANNVIGEEGCSSTFKPQSHILVPEPATIIYLGLGLLGLASVGLRRKA